MNIKNCFILGAGKGTRMGEIGKQLPKAIWPLFEKSLLEFQISFASMLGCENFFINSHHLHEKIENYVAKNNLNITVLHEEELLDSAGAFYNLKKNTRESQFLYLNGDIAYFFDKSVYLRAFELMEENGICLIGVPVQKGEPYNQTVIENERLVEITPPNQEEDFVTYAGMGFIDLSKIDDRDGPQKFFSTFANPKEKNVSIVVPEGPIEYWDFGTKELYLESLARVSENTSSMLFRILSTQGFLDLSKFDLSSLSYNCDGEKCLNFSDEKIVSDSKDWFINLRGKPKDKSLEGLFFEGVDS